MFLNVLKNVIPTLLRNAPKLWAYNYVTIDDCTFNVLLVIYLNYYDKLWCRDELI